jgi:hypothetical protein
MTYNGLYNINNNNYANDQTGLQFTYMNFFKNNLYISCCNSNSNRALQGSLYYLNNLNNPILINNFPSPLSNPNKSPSVPIGNIIIDSLNNILYVNDTFNLNQGDIIALSNNNSILETNIISDIQYTTNGGNIPVLILLNPLKNNYSKYCKIFFLLFILI